MKETDGEMEKESGREKPPSASGRRKKKRRGGLIFWWLRTATVWLVIVAALYALFFIPLEPDPPIPPEPPAEKPDEVEQDFYSKTGKSCAEELASMKPEAAARYECVAVHFASNGDYHQKDATAPLKIVNGKKDGAITPDRVRPLRYGIAEVLVLKRTITKSESPDLPTNPQTKDFSRSNDGSEPLTVNTLRAVGFDGGPPQLADKCERAYFFGGMKAPAGVATDCVRSENSSVDDNSVASAAEKSNKRVLVYVHGMGNRFDQAVVHAAQLASDSQALRDVNEKRSDLNLPKCDEPETAPDALDEGATVRAPSAACYDIGAPIVFHWRNHEDLLAYRADKKLLIDDSAAIQLADFLVDLANTKNVDEINILAHSMGSRVLVMAWDRFANALIANRGSAPKINIVHASSELKVEEYEEAVIRLKKAFRGQIPDWFRRAIYASPNDLTMTLARIADGEASQIAFTGLAIKDFVSRATGIKKVVKSIRYSAAKAIASVASLAGDEAKRKASDFVLDLTALGPSCRIGDITADRCRKLTGLFKYSHEIDSPAFMDRDNNDMRIQIIETSASFTLDPNTIIGPVELGRLNDWADRIEVDEWARNILVGAVNVQKIGGAYVESLINHRGPLAKALSLTDLSCFYDEVPPDSEPKQRSLRKGGDQKRYYIADPKIDVPTECSPNGLTFAPADPTPEVIGAENIVLGNWPFKVPLMSNEAETEADDKAIEEFKKSFLKEFKSIATDAADFACSRRWVGVVASASFEGEADLNGKRAKIRAEKTASWLHELLGASAREKGCPEPFVFGVSLGQHTCPSDNCTPDQSSDFQRRIRLIDRPRNDRDRYKRSTDCPYKSSARDELDSFLRKHEKRLRTNNEEYPAAIVVWPESDVPETMCPSL